MRYWLIILFNFLWISIQAQSFMNKSPEEGLWEALEYYDIHHKEEVYAQVLLETGNFKSFLCVKNNNLFGLKRSRTKYYKYSHWSESVKAYKEKIQSRYRSGENYYKFLRRIHYAEDPKYISKVKRIRSKHFKK